MLPHNIPLFLSMWHVTTKAAGKRGISPPEMKLTIAKLICELMRVENGTLNAQNEQSGKGVQTAKAHHKVYFGAERRFFREMSRLFPDRRMLTSERW